MAPAVWTFKQCSLGDFMMYIQENVSNEVVRQKLCAKGFTVCPDHHVCSFILRGDRIGNKSDSVQSSITDMGRPLWCAFHIHQGGRAIHSCGRMSIVRWRHAVLRHLQKRVGHIQRLLSRICGRRWRVICEFKE